MNADSECPRHLQRIDDMKIVRPCFCEVFPWVTGRIGRNKTFLPVHGRAVGIVCLERPFIVGAIIAKDLATHVELSPVANKYIPEIVTDLVTKVTEQGAVGLMHCRASLL